MPMTANGLAKLLEELGELAQVAAKKLAYFDTDDHPDEKGSLKSRLEEEIADVQAACDFVSTALELNAFAIAKRRGKKLLQFHEWHNQPDNDADGFRSALESSSHE